MPTTLFALESTHRYCRVEMHTIPADTCLYLVDAEVVRASNLTLPLNKERGTQGLDRSNQHQSKGLGYQDR
jgi:hypothetical protein